ncbi:MAG: FAD-dependent oxidoreductase [Rikenellaceae bacterium]
MIKRIFSSAALALALVATASNAVAATNIFVEAENFSNKGGWVVDQQFMDLMGSPYLMAHGMGVPVESASSTVNICEDGKYHVYVRTYNWTSPWYDGAGPGAFKVAINGKSVGKELGTAGDEWMWQYAGARELSKGSHTIALEDLTGFNGRVDAIYLSTDQLAPPQNLKALEAFRRDLQGMSDVPQIKKEFDFVVVGGGVAGMCAAVAAAREGMHVALINDRPILGGCNSSEIRVHLGGSLDKGPYPNLGNLVKEFGHKRGGNAQPAEYYEDEAKQDFIDAEKNIELFANNRMIKVVMDGDIIKAVISKHIETGEETLFKADLFADCTGDGTVGALAGADFRMGREAKSEYNESEAPEVADKITMGSSVQWYSKECDAPSKFPVFEYGVEFTNESMEPVVMGEWTWETGMAYDQVYESEYIRDYGMMIIFSNWSFLKNKSGLKHEYTNRQLDWVAYVAGKRESRRLLGDYILNGNDVLDYNVMSDGTAATTWSVDLHYPDPLNTKFFPGNEFKSLSMHNKVYPYPIPYRCFYSRNVNNLFMAGRNISVTHMALGTVRVMRTTAMMGEVVGLAASVCKANDVLPRRVYQAHMPELITLMEKGAGKQGLENTQTFNTGGGLAKPPVAGSDKKAHVGSSVAKEAKEKADALERMKK